jgi:hypothetical protein
MYSLYEKGLWDYNCTNINHGNHGFLYYSDLSNISMVKRQVRYTILLYIIHYSIDGPLLLQQHLFLVDSHFTSTTRINDHYMAIIHTVFSAFKDQPNFITISVFSDYVICGI